MNIRSLLALTFLCVTVSAFAADGSPAATIKPGRYILVMHSAASEPNPDPILVEVKTGAAREMTIEPEKGSKGAIAMRPEGNSVVFSITMTGKDGIPGENQDWPVANVFTFAGKIADRVPNTIEGSFSDFSIYFHSTSNAPNLLTGTFLLYPIDAR